MTIITPPGTLPIRRIQWSLKQPAQINRSGWTGRRQVAGLPGGAIWTASGEFVPIIKEANARQWRGFFASLRGAFNTFYLPATEGDQHALALTVRVNGSLQAGRSLAIDGLPNSTTVLAAGTFISLPSTNQLLILTAALTSNASGQATAIFEPALRITPADNAIVETKNPVAHVALTSDTTGWSVDPGQLYGFTMDVEEVF
jgi:hypothetical protein